MDHRFHFSLTLATLGLWLPGWLIGAVWHAFRPWRCMTCNRARWFPLPEFRAPGAGLGSLTPAAQTSSPARHTKSE